MKHCFWWYLNLATNRKDMNFESDKYNAHLLVHQVVMDIFNDEKVKIELQDLFWDRIETTPEELQDPDCDIFVQSEFVEGWFLQTYIRKKQ